MSSIASNIVKRAILCCSSLMKKKKKRENAWTPHSATVYVLLHSHVPSLTFFSFENMFSSFIMKLAVGKEPSIQIIIVHSVSRLQNSEYYTQRETKYKNKFLSRFRPLTEKREKIEKALALGAWKLNCIKYLSPLTLQPNKNRYIMNFVCFFFFWEFFCFS